MKVQEAIKQIEKGEFQPNYLLLGSESYLQSTFISSLTAALSAADELDVMHIDLNVDTIQAVLDEAELYSFFTEYRLIIVENVTFLNAHPNQKLSDSEQKQLIAYLDNPNPNSIVVWRVSADELDKRKKITKAFSTKSTIVDVAAIKEQDVKHYLNSYIQENKLKITSDALNELLNRVQSNLSTAMLEIVKLKSYAISGKEVSIDVVQQLVPRVLESDVFELTNALLSRKAAKAKQIYDDLILMKHEPIAILALLISQFRLMLQVKLLSSTGQLEQNIASQLGVHPYRVKLASQLAVKYSLKDIQRFYQQLIETDFQMKTGIGDKEMYFYLLMTQFMQMK